MRIAKRFRKQCAWKAESRPYQQRFDNLLDQVRAKNRKLAKQVRSLMCGAQFDVWCAV
jgi:hypothetical protein